MPRMISVSGQTSASSHRKSKWSFFPELVSVYLEEGYKAVNYTGLTMALIEAAKELVSRCRYRDCAGLAFIRPSPLV
jgi:hypothetical protein